MPAPSIFRARRPLLTGVLMLLVPLSPSLAWPVNSMTDKPLSSQEVDSLNGTVHPADDQQPLVPGQPVQRTLQGGKQHVYEVRLAAGTYIEIEAMQQGIDLALLFKRPGAEPIYVDSPNGSKGAERFLWVTETDGVYRLEVISEVQDALPGDYRLSIPVLRPAAGKDQVSIQAWKLFLEGESRRRETAYLQAIESYNAALDLWREADRPEWEAQSLFRLGWMQQEVDQQDQALSHLQEALPLFQRLDQGFETALVLIRISTISLSLGEWDKALSSSQEALEIARSLDRPEVEAGALLGIGNVHKAHGSQTDTWYKEALARAREAKALEEEGIALYELGDLLIIQGKLQQARDLLEQALSAFEGAGSERKRGYTLRRLANIEQRLGNYQLAFAKLREAVLLARATNDRYGEAVALNSLGTLYLLENSLDKANDRYQAALEIFKKDGHRMGKAATLLNLGRLGHRLEDLDHALASYDESVALFRSLGDRTGEASALFGSALVLHDRRNFSAANIRLQQVVENVEGLRSESASQDLRASYFATKQHYFDLHIDVLMHLHEENPAAGYHRQAFELNERRRARSFRERLEESDAGLYRTPDAALIERRRGLQSSINSTERQLIDQRSRGQSRGVEALEKRQRELLGQLDALETEIKKDSARYVALTEPRPLTVPEIQGAVLEPDTFLLVFSLSEERSFLWLVPPTGDLEAHILSASRQYFDHAVGEILAGWREPSPNPSRESADRWAERLGTKLLLPIARHLGRKRLLVVADGPLQYLPLAALPDPRFPSSIADGKGIREMLVEHEIIHLPSASLLASLRLQKKRGDALYWAAVFADPIFGAEDPRMPKGDSPQAGENPRARLTEIEVSARDLGISPSFPRLPHTAAEAKALRKLLGLQDTEQVLEVVGGEANLSKLRQTDLRAFKILHFATHGLLNDRHPELSGLVLSAFDENGRPQEENFLLAHEIGNLELRAELVVLSACRTGLGQEVRGEGLVGLTRSFMYAGTPRVLVSLWNVNDKATAVLMERFYNAMVHHNRRPAEALRCAQLSMLQEPGLSAPYLWAPFIFQGEWRDQPGKPVPPIEKVAIGAGTTGALLPDIDLPEPGTGEGSGCPDLRQKGEGA